MKKAFYLKILVFSLITISISCKKDKDDDTPSCVQEQLPIVMVHGFLASGDTYANQFMRFTSNGYCQNYLYAYDWNTLDQSVDRDAMLDAFINEVLNKTKANKVNLVGHSAGGGLGYTYLSEANRAAKVAHYVHIGSFMQDGPAGPGGNVATLNIWSPDDLVVPSGDIPGATNVTISGADHYEVATASATFDAIYRFFNNGTAPNTINIVSESKVSISGKVLKLGENESIAGADVEVFQLDEFGVPIGSTPQYTIKSNSKGFWGPIDVVPNSPYLFKVVTNISGDRKVNYYREGFSRSNSLVYMRTLPAPTSLAGILLSSLPSNDNQSALIIFSANKAVISGRDELLVDGEEISTEDFAAADQTSIAFFLFDENDNQQSDFVPFGLFGSFPFLSSVDMYFPAQNATYIECEFNGRKQFVRNWKSSSEGIAIAVFD